MSSSFLKAGWRKASNKVRSVPGLKNVYRRDGLRWKWLVMCGDSVVAEGRALNKQAATEAAEAARKDHAYHARK